MKNVRLFKNAQNGKPKRVNTVTDDYGNRVHIVKKKDGKTVQRKASGGMYAKKRDAKFLSKRVTDKLYDYEHLKRKPPEGMTTKEKKRRSHGISAARRKLLTIRTGKTKGIIPYTQTKKEIYHDKKSHDPVKNKAYKEADRHGKRREFKYYDKTARKTEANRLRKIRNDKKHAKRINKVNQYIQYRKNRNSKAEVPKRTTPKSSLTSDGHFKKHKTKYLIGAGGVAVAGTGYTAKKKYEERKTVKSRVKRALNR